MTNYRLIPPALLAAAAVFAWGCTRPTAAAPDAKTPALEARVAQLERDVRALASARDLLQHRLSETEDRAAAAERDRDEARQELADRTAERDAIQSRYETFRKGLRELLGQADTAAARPLPPAAPVSPVSLPAAAPGGF